MKRYKIVRDPSVRFDVASILDFIGNYAGYALGRQKVAEISRAISRLSEFPHTGTPHSEIFGGLRVIPAGDKAVICFTVDDRTHVVKIICVTYAGQDWQAIARDRQEK